jgi:FkbM family methyltransferase
VAYYSDNGADRRIAEIFDEFVGHACDVGANDGTFISNTLHFEEKGWTVLCIEPNPLLAEVGRSKRKLWREVACAGVDDDSVDFYVVNGHATFASFSSLHMNGKKPAINDVFIEKVVVRRLDRVLEEAGFPKLDYLAVDVEGWEREVMSGFTVERWKPKVIVLEEWSGIPIVIPNYSIIEKRQFDNIYVREEV